MRKLILRNFQSPGDIVMLTAAVRDLHKSYPNNFLTDVRTPCGSLWENNPLITSLSDADPEAEVVDCHYPLIHCSNQVSFHFLQGFTEFLNQRLELSTVPSVFRGDVHISALEKSWLSQVEEITSEDTPFWIINAGGKYDYTIKWWSHQRYQRVV